MALVPARSYVEQMLLNGPQTLSAYPGESFSWVGSLVRERFCDWNTVISAGQQFGTERLRALCEMFDQMVLFPPPEPPRSEQEQNEAAFVDRQLESRKAVFVLRCVVSMAHTAGLACGEARRASLDDVASSLAKSDDRVDRRTRWEWLSWWSAMEATLLQTKSALENTLRARKRSLSDAEQSEPKRTAELPVHSAVAGDVASERDRSVNASV